MAWIYKPSLYDSISNERYVGQASNHTSYYNIYNRMSMTNTHHSSSFIHIDNNRSRASTNEYPPSSHICKYKSMSMANDSSSYDPIMDERSIPDTKSSCLYIGVDNDASNPRRNNRTHDNNSSSCENIGNYRSMERTNNYSSYLSNGSSMARRHNSSYDTNNDSSVAPTHSGNDMLSAQTNKSWSTANIDNNALMSRSSSYITISGDRSIEQTNSYAPNTHIGNDSTMTRTTNSSTDAHETIAQTNTSSSNLNIDRQPKHNRRRLSEPCLKLNLDEQCSFVYPTTIIQHGSKRLRSGKDAQSLRSDIRDYRGSENEDAYWARLKDSSSQINFVVQNPRNCNFSGRNSQNSIAVSLKSERNLKHKVEAQTLLVLREVQKRETGVIFGVKTNLYHLAKEKLKQPMSIQVLIINGEGLGCDFVAKMLFAEACLEKKTTGFYLRDVDEWIVANKHIGDEERGAVLILNAKITDWVNIIKHEMLPSAKKGDYLTVVMTTSDCDEECGTLSNFTVNATAQNALPSEKDQVQVFDMMSRRKCLQIEESCVDIASAATKTSRYPTITTETKSRILKDIGTYNWIRRLNTFFSGTIEDGSRFFRKPESTIVNYLRKQIPSKKDHQSTSVFCLLLIYVFGKLHVTTIEWIRTYKRIPEGKILKMLQKENAKDHNMKAFPRFKRIIKYCNGLHRLQLLIEILRDSMFIKLENGTFQFDGAHVRTSFMVAMSNVIPGEIVESCDEQFMFDCIGGREEGFKYQILGKDTKACKSFFKRMRYHWHEDMVKCIKHPSLALHFERFLQYLQCTKHALWPVLTRLDDTNTYCALFYGMETEGICERSIHIPTEVILQNSKWKKKRKQKKWKNFTRVQESFALIHAAELGNTTVFKALADYGVLITKDAIVAAIESRAVHIIENNIIGAKISVNELMECVYESVKLYASSKSKEDRHILEIFMKTYGHMLNFSNSKTVPLLHRVIDDQQMLEVLLEGEWGKLIDVDVVYYYNRHAKTALDLATEAGYNYTIQYLLSYGADPDAKRKRRLQW